MIPISIITINYNNRDGLKRTIDSIINQTCKDFEWIVIDGGSNDGGKDLLEQHDSHITYWVSEPDKGIYDAMNKGIQKANGEYCLFMNSGDCFYSSDVIKKILDNEGFGQYDIMTGYTYVSKGQKKIGIWTPPQEITGKLLFKNTLSHSASIIRTKHLKEHGGYDSNYKIASDVKFFYEDLVLRNATYKPMNFYISNFDFTGISIKNVALASNERDVFLKHLLPTAIYNDYKRMCYGETTLEKLLCKTEENSFFYKWMTLLAVISYAPISLKNRIVLHLKKLFSK